jgi:hypothetical protein
MRNLLMVCGLAAIGLSTFAPTAGAQDNAFTLTCQSFGAGAPEALGDREGHSISVGEDVCRVDSGLLSGGVATSTNIWEWNGTSAVLLSGGGVVSASPALQKRIRTLRGKLC